MITIAQLRDLNDRATYPNVSPVASRMMKQLALAQSPLSERDTHALMLIDDAIGNDEVGTDIQPLYHCPRFLNELREQVLRDYDVANVYEIPGAGYVICGESDFATRTIAISHTGTTLFDEQDSD